MSLLSGIGRLARVRLVAWLRGVIERQIGDGVVEAAALARCRLGAKLAWCRRRALREGQDLGGQG
jgi:hypothetical protein